MKSISTLFRQLFLIVVLISAFSLSAWGGEEIISNTFSSTTMQKSVSSYTDTWNNISGTELKLVNFNNNQKKWTYVKCGRKSTTSIGTITTTSPLTEKITKVEVTIDAVTTSKINSTYLQVASDASFTQNVQKVIVTIATGTITYEIPTPTSNCYYRLTYDCASGSSNGLVTISKVNFYYNTGESGGGETETIPTISASNLSFGTLTESNTTQTLTVVGANLTDAITATLKTGTAFEVAGTLTKDGGDLTIKFIATTAGEYTDQITLTSGETTTTINVSAKLVKLEGNGTIENPYTCSDINILNNNPDFKGKYWVKGYIIGCLTNNKLETSTTETRSNLAFSDNTENVSSVYIPVQLPDNPVRVALNLVDNPNLVGKEIMVYGTLEAYFSKPGVKNVTDYKIIYDDLTIESGTTHNITEKIALSTLTIKSNPDDEAGEVNVTDGAALSANKVIIEKTIDASRWFFFSLPFDCKISDIVATDADGNSLTYDTHYVISKYNPTRAEGQNNAWEELLDTELKLNANQGYIIGHWYEQSDNIIVKFPSTDAQTITAPADKTLNYTNTWFVNEENKNSSKGFNLIGMPYYQKINSTISCGDVYIYSTTPNEDGKTYNQDAYTGNNVAPFTSFFVQVAENTAPTFTITETQSAAPMLRAKDVVAKATITLADANGGADETTIINNPSKTTDYEIGHDLVKWIGYAEIPQIYSLQGEEMLAFNSLAIDNSTVIPLGVYAHADGDYTFSLSEKSVGNLEGWELYDNETGKTTRLANEDLTVNLAQGTHEGRFEIRLQQRISTDCDNAMGDMTTWTANGTLNINNLPADAVVYIYDAVGRMVYVANNNSTTFNYTFAARGVYNIVVRTAENSVSFKTIY